MGHKYSKPNLYLLDGLEIKQEEETVEVKEEPSDTEIEAVVQQAKLLAYPYML